MVQTPIGARKERILRAIIDDYVRTAVPVGSRTISRKYETSLSSATIRNEMSDLEELGYLAQPHVSAGRVPSAKAYRLYVDELLDQGALQEDPEARNYFSERVRQVEDVVTSAAQALSEVTRYTALVMMPKQLELRVSCLQLVPMPRGAALLVIVTDTGAIRDTVIRVSEGLDGDALYAISRMLTERLAARTWWRNTSAQRAMRVLKPSGCRSFPLPAWVRAIIPDFRCMRLPRRHWRRKFYP